MLGQEAIVQIWAFSVITLSSLTHQDTLAALCLGHSAATTTTRDDSAHVFSPLQSFPLILDGQSNPTNLAPRPPLVEKQTTSAFALPSMTVSFASLPPSNMLPASIEDQNLPVDPTTDHELTQNVSRVSVPEMITFDGNNMPMMASLGSIKQGLSFKASISQSA